MKNNHSEARLFVAKHFLGMSAGNYGSHQNMFRNLVQMILHIIRIK